MNPSHELTGATRLRHGRRRTGLRCMSLLSVLSCLAAIFLFVPCGLSVSSAVGAAQLDKPSFNELFLSLRSLSPHSTSFPPAPLGAKLQTTASIDKRPSITLQNLNRRSALKDSITSTTSRSHQVARLRRRDTAKQLLGPTSALLFRRSALQRRSLWRRDSQVTLAVLPEESSDSLRKGALDSEAPKNGSVAAPVDATTDVGEHPPSGIRRLHRRGFLKTLKKVAVKVAKKAVVMGATALGGPAAGKAAAVGFEIAKAGISGAIKGKSFKDTLKSMGKAALKETLHQFVPGGAGDAIYKGMSAGYKAARSGKGFGGVLKASMGGMGKAGFGLVAGKMGISAGTADKLWNTGKAAVRGYQNGGFKGMLKAGAMSGISNFGGQALQKIGFSQQTAGKLMSMGSAAVRGYKSGGLRGALMAGAQGGLSSFGGSALQKLGMSGSMASRVMNIGGRALQGFQQGGLRGALQSGIGAGVSQFGGSALRGLGLSDKHASRFMGIGSAALRGFQSGGLKGMISSGLGSGFQSGGLRGMLGAGLSGGMSQFGGSAMRRFGMSGKNADRFSNFGSSAIDGFQNGGLRGMVGAGLSSGMSQFGGAAMRRFGMSRKNADRFAGMGASAMEGFQSGGLRGMVGAGLSSGMSQFGGAAMRRMGLPCEHFKFSDKAHHLLTRNPQRACPTR
ncbi:hypothetical protein DFJ73DRAFT_28895 [Zopfochytrium polystomum]|nr:hypothetical protein DFJ73DRAFT_28895 [Zopfochytrium polystomum]